MFTRKSDLIVKCLSLMELIPKFLSNCLFPTNNCLNKLRSVDFSHPNRFVA